MEEKKIKKIFSKRAKYLAIKGASTEEIATQLMTINCPEKIANELAKEVISNKKGLKRYRAKAPLIGGILLFLVAPLPIIIWYLTAEPGEQIVISKVVVGITLASFFFISQGIYYLISRLPFEKKR